MTDAVDARRSVLPMPDVPYTGLVTYDAKDPDTSFPRIEPLRPPAGAPNVLLVLIDDVGFGASSAFGGLIETPIAERLAGNGVKYTRFHTTALCAPTRAALLSGRNHHSVGYGSITETATSAPGNNTLRPNSKAALAEILRLNGYATAQFGKCHEVPVWETSPAGPFDRWPTGCGFEHFYGFIGGETNQYYPAIYDGTTAVEPDKTPEEGYHFTEDMTDRSIDWIRQQKALQPDRPFFCYWAPGATHAPHHAPQDWIEKYRGRFDAGWDAVREEIFARQKALGVIPADADLTTHNPEIPTWDEMDDALKPVLARQMEVYAAFLAHTDFHLGRVVDALEQLEVLDDTLIIYIVGDNGASAEGTVNGSFNEMINFNGFGAFETPDFLREHLEEIGGPKAYNHYAVGWAHAMCTPYQWTKQVASHFGGTRNGTIMHWPNGIEGRGELRHQFHHVIDIAPTILDIAGLPQPVSVSGVNQAPIEGVSMRPTFTDADAPEARETQYFEMFGNRGVYHKGWTAVTKHKTPWILVGGDMVPFDDDVWELYDTTTDWTQAHDISAEHPDKLHELQRLWLIEAVRYGVLPLDDRTGERLNPDIAGRPTLIQGDHQVLFPRMGRLNEQCVLNLKNVSHSVTAEVWVPDDGVEGVLIAQGGVAGGWSLYVKDGRLKYCYNLLGLQQTFVESDRTVPPGTHQLRMEFAYDGGGLAKGGTIRLFVDGEPVGEGRVEATEPMIFSADETTDVGKETGSVVTTDYPAVGNDFTGAITWIQLDLGDDDQDHLISDEDRYRVAMARQ